MSIRNERINIRLSKEENNISNKKCLNLSSDTFTSLLNENDIDYSTATPTILNGKQFNKLLQILRNPPKPNDNLKKMRICKKALLEVAQEKK